jgi:phosphoglucosamine mutase
MNQGPGKVVRKEQEQLCPGKSAPVLKLLGMTDKPQLFGTDGVRGVAGEYPLDRATVRKLGRALGIVLGKTGSERPLTAVLGEDTRESSKWISESVASGLRSAGVEVAYAGVITTPGVAHLTRRNGFSAGIMVSASHNPFSDNGIKVLSPSGTKLSESTEVEIERVLGQIEISDADSSASQLRPVASLLEEYLNHLETLAPARTGGHAPRLVIDCGHGASARVVPALLKRLNLEARILNAQPDGRNINLNCGSLHPETMAEETKFAGADLGVAFDGDADRAMFSTREGRIADGDHVLFAVAPFLEKSGLLKGKAVVGTLMTNLGLELALEQKGIALKRTSVGDKYVLEEMLRSGINLGGEPSGHIIFSDISLAGDGIVTMLEVLRLMSATGKPFGELVGGLKQFPQLIRNVRVREKPPLDSIPEISGAIDDCRNEVGERGRVVVRYSGTERLARVMVEAEYAEVVERHALRIAAAIDRALGVR